MIVWQVASKIAPHNPHSWDSCAHLEYGLNLVNHFECIEYGKNDGVISKINLQKESDVCLAYPFLLTLMKTSSHL